MNRLYIAIILLMLSVSISCTKRLSVADNGNWVKLKNVEQDYYHLVNDSIICGYIDPWRFNSMLPRMKGVDITTFEVCDGTAYARDSFHVYYPVLACIIESDCYDGLEVVIYLTDADPKTFKYIGDEYGADKRHMYYRGKRIKWDNEVIRSKGLSSSAYLKKKDIFDAIRDK